MKEATVEILKIRRLTGLLITHILELVKIYLIKLHSVLQVPSYIFVINIRYLQNQNRIYRNKLILFFFLLRINTI